MKNGDSTIENDGFIMKNGGSPLKTVNYCDLCDLTNNKCDLSTQKSDLRV
jgi:hypothetical protein